MVLEDSGTCHEVVIATVPMVLVMASPGSRQRVLSGLLLYQL